MVSMKTDTKQSIEEAAEQLLIWKVKGEGDISHIIDKAEVLDAGIQYLIDKKYIIKRKPASKPCLHDVTFKGFAHVYGAKKEIHANL